MDNTSPPRIDHQNLDSDLATALDKPTDVVGAVTDGASICLVRIVPPVSPEGLQLHATTFGSETSCAATTNPIVVGNLFAAERPLNESGQAGDWEAFEQTLPFVPLPWPPETAAGYSPDGADFSHGLAFYVPPESFTGSPVSSLSECSTLSQQIEHSIAFEVRLEQAGSSGGLIHRMPFALRRPPAIVVHGLFGHAFPAGGRDTSGYWSPNFEEVSPDSSLRRLHFFNYENTNMQGFDTNIPLLADFYLAVLEEQRSGIQFAPADHDPMTSLESLVPERRFAASRVDFVGHSMGGNIIQHYILGFGSIDPCGLGLPSLQPRPRPISGYLYGWPDINLTMTHTQSAYSVENWFAGPSRRFVSIGTPFRGSPLGTVVTPAFSPLGINRRIGSNTNFLKEASKMPDLFDKISRMWTGGIQPFSPQPSQSSPSDDDSDAKFIRNSNKSPDTYFANGQYIPPTALYDLSDDISYGFVAYGSLPGSLHLRMPRWSPIAGRPLTSPYAGLHQWDLFSVLDKGQNFKIRGINDFIGRISGIEDLQVGGMAIAIVFATELVEVKIGWTVSDEVVSILSQSNSHLLIQIPPDTVHGNVIHSHPMDPSILNTGFFGEPHAPSILHGTSTTKPSINGILNGSPEWCVLPNGQPRYQLER